MKKKTIAVDENTDDPLISEVFVYLNRYDFHLAFFIQRKFKIGFTRAEKILKQIEAKKITIK